ncbi:MAG: DUF6498-containing protein [Pseudomonadota bacterium]
MQQNTRPDDDSLSESLTEVHAYTGLRRSTNLSFLVLANLIPLFGVAVFAWDVGALVVLYWAENLIIGVYTILKMFTKGRLSAVPMALFFCFHFGGFCAVHGLFISLLLLGIEEPMASSSWPFPLVFFELLYSVVNSILAEAPQAWLLAFLGLCISHGYSFVSNFIQGKELEGTNLGRLMASPYKRIIVLHVAVMAGGFAASALGQPQLMLLALVLLKIIVDIKLHLKEHSA